jgi:hypothetical protein
MNTATITKVLKKVENASSEYSLGFRRLTSLPARIKKSFDLAANLETNFDGQKALNNQKAFLESLTEKEFINWLKIA